MTFNFLILTIFTPQLITYFASPQLNLLGPGIMLSHENSSHNPQCPLENQILISISLHSWGRPKVVQSIVPHSRLADIFTRPRLISRFCLEDIHNSPGKFKSHAIISFLAAPESCASLSKFSSKE